MRIKTIVTEIVKQHGSSNPYEICRNLDVILLRVPLKKVNGFYQRFEDEDLIFINDTLNTEESMLVLAHELGHLILHKDVNSLYLDTYNQSTNRYEVEANAFAILLLKDRLNLTEEIPLLDWRYNNEKLISLVA